MDQHREYNCLDCGVHVYSWTQDLLEQRCAVCKWIHDQPNLTPEEIAEIRRITATPVPGEPKVQFNG